MGGTWSRRLHHHHRHHPSSFSSACASPCPHVPLLSHHRSSAPWTWVLSAHEPRPCVPVIGYQKQNSHGKCDRVLHGLFLHDGTGPGCLGSLYHKYHRHV